MGVVLHQSTLKRLTAPTCSICIANFNGEGMLADCLDSVMAQRCDVAFEVIVHDDASTDASVALLRKRYPQVELLASQENVGFCISNNRMAEHARGEFILLLNNDAALFPDAIAAMLAVAGAREFRGIVTLPQYDWMTGDLVDRGCLLDPFYNPTPNMDPNRTDIAMTIGACLFVSRALWHELGGFPEWFESIGEDLYICCLARLGAARVQVTPHSGYRHRQGASFGGNRVVSNALQTTYRRRRLSERNKTSVMTICTPTNIAWVLLALHAILLTVEGAALSSIRFDRKIWSEIYWPSIQFACRAPFMLRDSRHKVQSERRIGLREYLRHFVWFPRKLLLLRRHGVPAIR